MRSLQRDYSIANNVVQQKGSFCRCRICCKWCRSGSGWWECTARAKCDLWLSCCRKERMM